MAKLISGTYGEALFSLAVEENKVDQFYEEVLTLKKIFDE
ncbi:MAG TPA: F0F1 ATP synthase subunit delta, partial [Lachnospiraceae bacterium]|nr:F0F1 ATP synthase subunit delta [Lachnospiraceae bacterium]